MFTSLKRVVSKGLLAVLLLTTFSPAFTAEATDIPPAGYEDDIELNQYNWFTDIDPDSRIGIAANYLASNSIIGGYSDRTFRPDKMVNRAEMAKFITNADGECAVNLNDAYNSIFWDIKPGEWYVPYVNAAAKCGIIEGNPDGSFKPDQPVNTVEILAMLTRATSFKLPTGLPHSFKDVPLGMWYEKYAGIAYQYNLFPERGDYLQPERQLNRGEVAYALYAILTKDDYTREEGLQVFIRVPETVNKDEVGTFKLTAFNDKETSEKNVKIVDKIDPALDIEITGTDRRCGKQGDKVVCNLGRMTASQVTTMTVAYKVPKKVDCGTTIYHNADIRTDGTVLRTVQDQTKVVCNQLSSLTLTSPNGGEVWEENNTYNIEWNSTGVESIHIAVQMGGKDRGTIAHNIPAKQGSYAWYIPEGYVTGFGIEQNDDMYIHISDASDYNIRDKNDAPFTIKGSSNNGDSCRLPGSSQLDVTSDGRYLYIVTWGEDRKQYVYLMDENCNIMRKRYELKNSIFGLAYDGGNFWGTSGGNSGALIKFDRNFREIRTIKLPYGAPHGLAYDDGRLWTVYNTATDEITVTDIRTGQTRFMFYAPANAPYGLTSSPSNLWVGANGNIYGLNKITGNVEHTINSPTTGGYISGLTVHNKYLWAVDNNDDRIYKLEIPYSPNRLLCGNGIVEEGEQCDDGNTVSNDGCSDTCQKETCTDSDGGINYEQKGTISVLNYGSMTDMCTGNTLTEYYCKPAGEPAGTEYACPYGCENGACKPEQVAECGNGVTEGSEECDDGNQNDYDSCSNQCTAMADRYKVIYHGVRWEIEPYDVIPGLYNVIFYLDLENPDQNLPVPRYEVVTYSTSGWGIGSKTDLAPGERKEAVVNVKGGKPGEYDFIIKTYSSRQETVHVKVGPVPEKGYCFANTPTHSRNIGYALLGIDQTTYDQCKEISLNRQNEIDDYLCEYEDDGNKITLAWGGTENIVTYDLECDVVQPGSLHVTSAPPDRSHLLFGGMPAFKQPSVLSVNFMAKNSDIEVREIIVTSELNNAETVENIYLYRGNEVNSFAVASRCSASYSGNLFCAFLDNKQLIVPKNQKVTISMRPNMKREYFADGYSGQKIKFSITQKDPIKLKNGILVQKEDIFGQENTVTYANIDSVTNGFDQANGSLTNGIRDIGAFKITAASNLDNNGNDVNGGDSGGTNEVTLKDMVLNVEASNVSLKTNSFRLYSQEDRNTFAACGLTESGDEITGSFTVQCTNLADLLGGNARVENGDEAIFVLAADVLNTRINASQRGRLVVSLTDYADYGAGAIGPDDSHIRWADTESSVPNSSDSTFYFVDQAPDPVVSTVFED